MKVVFFILLFVSQPHESEGKSQGTYFSRKHQNAYITVLCCFFTKLSLMHLCVNHRLHFLVRSAHTEHKMNAKCRLLSRLSSSVIIHTVNGL